MELLVCASMMGFILVSDTSVWMTQSYSIISLSQKGTLKRTLFSFGSLVVLAVQL